MRIFLLVLTMIFAINTCAFAKDNIKFIYIHGTNDNNYKKKLEFKKGVVKLHPYLLKEFNKSPIVNKFLLQNGKYKISEKPLPFYWGDQSKADLDLLADWLDITKFFSPKLAQTVRSMLAHTLHDAIWVQKYNNMKPVIEKLHKITSIAVEREDKYVLLGHSAGSFITLEYMLYKLPVLNTEKFFRAKKVSEKEIAEMKKIGIRNTCVDALIASGTVIYKKDNTFYVEKTGLVENYKKIATLEKSNCTSINNVAGIIIFGSPISLFYSGYSDENNSLFRILAKGIVENNIFFISINFAEDPLGFPIATEDDYANIVKYGADDNSDIGKNNEIKNIRYGFLYDKSNVRSNKFVANAHGSYWTKRKLFAKSVVKAYEEGINTFVDATIIEP